MNVELELSKLNDENKKFQNEIQKLKKPVAPPKASLNDMEGEVRLPNGKMLDLGYVKE